MSSALRTSRTSIGFCLFGGALLPVGCVWKAGSDTNKVKVML